MRKVKPTKREKLADMVIDWFTAQGHQVRVSANDLWPVTGYWARQDVYRWEGQFDMLIGDKWSRMSIASWDTMTLCVKGFDVARDGFHFELHATC